MYQTNLTYATRRFIMPPPWKLERFASAALDAAAAVAGATPLDAPGGFAPTGNVSTIFLSGSDGGGPFPPLHGDSMQR